MISGIIKSSYVDYPGEIAFVIFLGGCNLGCPYCHNKTIVLRQSNIYPIDSVLDMLKERQGFISAVVISGGEPTIWNNKLKELIIKIKELGFLIKLDTNGTNPEVVKNLLEDDLLDYIAMDIKNSFAKYNSTSGADVDITKIKESIKLIEESGVDYQFRSTLNKTMHTKEDVSLMKSYIKDSTKLKFQDYKYSSEQLVDKDYGIYNKKDLL